MSTRTLKCDVPLNALKAAILFAAKNDIRKYLEGVCLDHTERGTRLVATDGHRLFCFLIETTPSAKPTRYVVAADVIKSAIKLRAKAPTVAFEWSQETYREPERPSTDIAACAKIAVGGIATTDVQDTASRFPEYERIVPEKCSGELAQYNANYLADIGKAQELLGRKRGFVQVAMNGDAAGLAVLRDDAFALIMPFRMGDAPVLPDWFLGKSGNAAEEAA